MVISKKEKSSAFVAFLTYTRTVQYCSSPVKQ